MSSNDGAEGEKTEDGRAPRWNITNEALVTLEDVFWVQPFPPIAMREKLARTLQVTPRQVQIWFQNRRQRARQVKDDPGEDGAAGAFAGQSTSAQVIVLASPSHDSARAHQGHEGPGSVLVQPGVSVGGAPAWPAAPYPQDSPHTHRPYDAMYSPHPAPTVPAPAHSWAHHHAPMQPNPAGGPRTYPALCAEGTAHTSGGRDSRSPGGGLRWSGGAHLDVPPSSYLCTPRPSPSHSHHQYYPPPGLSNPATPTYGFDGVQQPPPRGPGGPGGPGAYSSYPAPPPHHEHPGGATWGCPPPPHGGHEFAVPWANGGGAAPSSWVQHPPAGGGGGGGGDLMSHQPGWGGGGASPMQPPPSQYHQLAQAAQAEAAAAHHEAQAAQAAEAAKAAMAAQAAHEAAQWEAQRAAAAAAQQLALAAPYAPCAKEGGNGAGGWPLPTQPAALRTHVGYGSSGPTPAGTPSGGQRAFPSARSGLSGSAIHFASPWGERAAFDPQGRTAPGGIQLQTIMTTQAPPPLETGAGLHGAHHAQGESFSRPHSGTHASAPPTPRSVTAAAHGRGQQGPLHPGHAAHPLAQPPGGCPFQDPLAPGAFAPFMAARAAAPPAGGAAGPAGVASPTAALHAQRGSPLCRAAPGTPGAQGETQPAKDPAAALQPQAASHHPDQRHPQPPGAGLGASPRRMPPSAIPLASSSVCASSDAPLAKPTIQPLVALSHDAVDLARGARRGASHVGSAAGAPGASAKRARPHGPGGGGGKGPGSNAVDVRSASKAALVAGGAPSSALGVPGARVGIATPPSPVSRPGASAPAPAYISHGNSFETKAAAPAAREEARSTESPCRGQRPSPPHP